ncbi:TRAP transporter small permease subunit [Alkalibaculum sp. M08DMB]|uniref:TRAP transporter small permease subunit n=1 Tax=Alkalibaculum sporogenes TaxID=2655001 RepID=A0A6A7K847_9FIRM|nr:TRAP transporter small permease [Alkalibaculum sporogenes]MPW25594.1 TRAP transporter small permease subunit [Alkalibaculum sporogenes]
MQKISMTINRIASYISATIMFILTIWTVLDVAGRYLLNKPVRGTYEITELALVLIVFFGLGYAQHRDDHVVIDLLYTKFPKKLRFIVYEFGIILSIVISILMTWRLYLYGIRMQSGNYVTSVLSIPLYPVVIFAVIGSICFLLSLISSLFTFNKSEGEDE